jgi:hypothetical protein
MIIDYNSFKIVSYQTMKVTYHLYNIAYKIYNMINPVPFPFGGYWIIGF